MPYISFIIRRLLAGVCVCVCERWTSPVSRLAGSELMKVFLPRADLRSAREQRGINVDRNSSM